MSTMTDTSKSTSVDVPLNQSVTFRTEGTSIEANKAVPRPKIGRVFSRYNHLFAIHSKTRHSPLTRGDQTEAPNYNGFRNLMALVLVVSNLRLMLENFKKYGVLICIRCHDYRREDVIYGSILYFSVPFHLLIAWAIELVAARQAQVAVTQRKKTDSELPVAAKQARDFQLAWYLIAIAHALNATANLAIASFVVYYIIHHPGIGTLCELHAIITWLKVCSYAFTNRDLRHAYLYPDPATPPLPEIYKSCPYPQNITLKNLSYFWWAPTLVYQPVYPRTAKIRWDFVFKRLVEVVSLAIVIWVASAQYAVPLLQNSLDHIAALDLVSIIERVMKLSTISLFCWLAGFFLVFQSALNALAEVMRFGDREFYGDWWNSVSIRTYWTSWNKPVYHFMKRHIYAPLVGRGVPPYLAQIIVFVFSGLLHELLVGIPTHNLLWVAFAGMMWQVPLILLTDPLIKAKSDTAKTIGNLTFWVTFCLVGQPLAALLYFFAWQAKYGSGSVAEKSMFQK